MAQAKQTDYRKLNEELDGILLQLEAADVDVDKAVKLYERGMKIIQHIEVYLSEAENKVERVKQKFDAR